MIEFGNLAAGAAIASAYDGSPLSFNPMTDVVISRKVGDDLVGGAIFYAYNKASIAVHVAAFTPAALSKDLLWVCVHYPFMQLKCRKILAFIPSCNAKSLELAERIGLREEARIVDAHPGGDIVIKSLAKEDCRWLGRIKPSSIRENA